MTESNGSLQLIKKDTVTINTNSSYITCMCVVHIFAVCDFSQWRAGVGVAGLLLRNRLGCRVTSALWYFLIRVTVNTQNDSVLGTCRDRVKASSLDQLYLAFTPAHQRREPSH